MRLRTAAIADAEACAEIHLRARRAMAYLPQDLHTPAETRDWMRAPVFARQSVTVAEVGGAVVGFLALDGPLITNLYLRPDHQSRGIGSALLEDAKRQRPDGLELWVFEPNRGAIRFYERHGFIRERQSDGRGNEEKVPDRLMIWRPRPAGVLSP